MMRLKLDGSQACQTPLAHDFSLQDSFFLWHDGIQVDYRRRWSPQSKGGLRKQDASGRNRMQVAVTVELGKTEHWSSDGLYRHSFSVHLPV